MNSLRGFWADSRGKLIIVLLLVWVTAMLHNFSWAKFTNPAMSVLIVIALDWLISRARKSLDIFSLSSVVSGLLIGLILDPTGNVLLIILADVLAVFDKQFLRVDFHRHIFNPAAFGILITAQLFNGNVAWWAVSWGLVPTIVIGFGMIYVLWQIRRLFLPLTFLMIYFFIILTKVGSTESLRFIFDGTAFLFAFVMVPEPMTSLAQDGWQYLWGIMVGLLLLGFIEIPFQIIDPMLAALLTANFLGFVWKNYLRPRFLSGNASY